MCPGILYTDRTQTPQAQITCGSLHSHEAPPAMMSCQIKDYQEAPGEFTAQLFHVLLLHQLFENLSEQYRESVRSVKERLERENEGLKN